MHSFEGKLVSWMLAFTVLTSGFLSGQDCDLTINSSIDPLRGKFHSPGWPKQYPNQKRCVYKFLGRSNERIKIHFNVFNLQGMPPSCRYDYIDIYIQLTGPTDSLLDSPVLGRFCGESMEDLPDLIISTHNVIIIVLYTDSNKPDQGFEGDYSFISAAIYNIGTLVSPTGCGFSISSRERRTGYVVSPTYPGIYPDNIRCFYEFHGSPGERIRINFEDFSLFHGDEYCPFDYVIIRDGSTNSSPVIGTFCGKYSNLTLFSTREYLYIEFVTRSGRVSFDSEKLNNAADYNFERTGFNISYEFSSRFVDLGFLHNPVNNPDASHVRGTECDIKIESGGKSNGTFYSPGYPGYFPLNVICLYYLDGFMNSDHLENVRVKFRDFDIPGETPHCTEGYLAVNTKGHRRGNHQELEEKFCGNLRPPEFKSKDPRMIITFNTHGASLGKGFIATYQFLTDYAIDDCLMLEEGKCKCLFASKMRKGGRINSPRYPENYPDNIECTYIFQPEKGEQLLISFDMFDLGRESDITDNMCMKTDYVELYRKHQTEGDFYPAKRYCGTVYPGPILAKDAQIVFKSYSGSENLGFVATYDFKSPSQIKSDCGKVIHSTGTGGVIESPHFPQRYEDSTFCEWYIHASRLESKILIQFQQFKIEGQMPSFDEGDGSESGCKNAVMRIHGQTPEELCGTQTDEAFLSIDNTMHISFLTSSKALGAMGFKISWTEIHGHDLGEACYGFECEVSKYCISNDLKCNGLPNCGKEDNSDETWSESDAIGAQKAGIQYIHIAIGTTISVFFCIVLLMCGVYHRQKFRTRRGAHASDNDHVEVRYVAATSGSNTTDRLLTLDQTPDQTTLSTLEHNEIDTNTQQQNHTSHHTPHTTETSEKTTLHHPPNSTDTSVKTTPSVKDTNSQEPKQSRPVKAPHVQKVSIV